MKKYLISILIIVGIILAFFAGVYFSKTVYSVLGGLGNNIKNFEKTDVGNLIRQVGSEVFNPPPLRVNNSYKNVVLVGSKIVSETNIQRNINGNLPALFRNETLDKAALAKANDMFKNQYFEHVSPAGIDPGTLVKSFGYNYIITGENLILGNFASEKDLVAAWMQSPGHRENILNSRYTEIGLALVKGVYKGETVWISVQEFGLPLTACKQPDANLKATIDNLKVQLDNLSNQIDRKREEINNSTSDYKKYNALVEEYNILVKQYEAMAGDIKNMIANYNNQISVFNKCVVGENQ